MTTAEVEALVGDLPQGSRLERSGIERVKAFVPAPSAESPPSDADPYDLIFGPAVRLPLRRDNTALLLVDAQRLTCDPAVGLGKRANVRSALDSLDSYYERVRAALAGMRQLVDAAHEAGLPVIHVRTAGHRPDGRDLSRKTRSQGIAAGRGSVEAELMPEVAPAANDVVLDKPGSGAFTGAGLDELLRNLGIEHVILGGVSYDGAVESSIRSATDRGYGLVLAPEACATSTDALQAGLWGMESGIIQVKPLSEIVAQVRDLPASAGGAA